MSTEAFSVAANDRAIRVLMKTPRPVRGDSILYLTFASTGDESLNHEGYNAAAEYLLFRGHRVASFDLPCHGSRINAYGEGITGFRNSFVDGVDPFVMFTQDCTAALDACVARGIATPGRIAIGGTSRGGYMALRAAAADDRIAAATAFAPVTDWTILAEFAADTQRPTVMNLRLVNYANALAGKPVFTVISRDDSRVSTDSCIQFNESLVAANISAGFRADLAEGNVTDDMSGHTCNTAWYVRGGQFIDAWSK